MNRTTLIAAIALLASTAAAAQAERAANAIQIKWPASRPPILILTGTVEKVSPKLEEAAGVAIEFAGMPKVAAAVMSLEDQIKKDGKDAWCALARKAFPPLTER
jgi:hypothetical protein